MSLEAGASKMESEMSAATREKLLKKYNQENYDLKSKIERTKKLHDK